MRKVKFAPQPAPTCGMVHMLANATQVMIDNEVARAAASGTPPRAKNVPPHMFDVEALDRPMPQLPDEVRTRYAGRDAIVMAKICAAMDGHIDQVSIISGIPGADATIVETLRRWRLRPQPIPICTLVKFQFATPPLPKPVATP